MRKHGGERKRTDKEGERRRGRLAAIGVLREGALLVEGNSKKAGREEGGATSTF